MFPNARSRRRPKRAAHALGATVALGAVLYNVGVVDPALSAGRDDASTPVAATPLDDSPPGELELPEANDGGVEAVPDPASSAREAVAPVDSEVRQADADGPDVAEQIAMLERTIRANTEELAKQQSLLDDAEGSEYQKAEAAFSTLDSRHKDLEKALKQAESNDDPDLESIRVELDELTKRWKLAKDRFELEVRERKAANEQVDLLTRTIAADERRLSQLLGDDEAPSAPTTTPAATTAEAAPADPTPAPAAPPAQEAPAEPAAAPPAIPGLTNPLAPAAPKSAADATEAEAAKPKSVDVIEAEQKVQQKAAVAQQVEERSKTLDERLALLDRSIETLREQLRNAEAKADNAEETRNLLTGEFRDKSLADAPQDELRELRDRIQDAEGDVSEANAEIRDRTARLEDLRDQRDLLFEARQAAIREAADARAQEIAARAKLSALSNPLSIRNIVRWLVTRGPAILAILLAMALLHWLIGRFSQRIADLIVKRGNRGSQAERDDRANTLVGVFQNAATAVILIGGGIMVLDQAGIPIAPILGGAAVLGLAISFGAQNLVSDFFYGFMILIENQYKLNDVIKINDHSGQVERITLRMTALRDLEGNLHFIPNGQIDSVVNMTHGWSRALFDIGVAYKENVDQVMSVIMDVGKEMRKDPRFRMLILEDPTMLGVDSFADSAVVIKFFIKTRPLQQWAVKRELLRRLKNRFDELGIEIPFPHRTVYHHHEDDALGRYAATADQGIGGNGFSN